MMCVLLAESGQRAFTDAQIEIYAKNIAYFLGQVRVHELMTLSVFLEYVLIYFNAGYILF